MVFQGTEPPQHKVFVDVYLTMDSFYLHWLCNSFKSTSLSWYFFTESVGKKWLDAKTLGRTYAVKQSIFFIVKCGSKERTCILWVQWHQREERRCQVGDFCLMLETREGFLNEVREKLGIGPNFKSYIAILPALLLTMWTFHPLKPQPIDVGKRKLASE